MSLEPPKPNCKCMFRVEKRTGILKLVRRCSQHRLKTPRPVESYDVEYYRGLGVLEPNVGHVPQFKQYMGELEIAYEGLAIEAGCGISPYVDMFTLHGYRYVAIEPSPEACKYMADNYNVECHQFYLDKTRLIIYEDAADIVFSAHCLEHVHNLQLAVFNLVQMIKPGGLLYTIVPDSTDLYNPDHVYYFSIETLESLLKSFGLEIVNICEAQVVPHEKFIYSIARKPLNV